MSHNRSIESVVICVLYVGCGGSLSDSRDDSQLDWRMAIGTPGPGASSAAIQAGIVGLFPGGGTSGAAAPLANGHLCDAANTSPPGVSVVRTECFYGSNAPASPMAMLEQVLECAQDKTTNMVHVRLTLSPAFVDNTYGRESSVGWPHKRGHRFSDLVKSDHAEIALYDGAGQNMLQFKLDYFSVDPSQPSGYGSLGVRGGDGAVSIGSAAAILDWNTSLGRNFNQRGYSNYTVDSPATDANYTPNAAAPGWDYRVVYEAWIDANLFGAAEFGTARISYIHASPAKGGGDTIEVTPGTCPPPLDACNDGIPDTYCSTGEPPTGDEPCGNDIPDNGCGGGGPPPESEPNPCRESPDAPGCSPD
jgi:hypothetical protein